MYTRSLFHSAERNILYRMKDQDLTSLITQKLVDFHRKTHMLYGSALRRHPQNKQFINSIVSLHNKLVEEMLKRNIRHNTPLKKI